MAVYTVLDQVEVATFVDSFGLGQLVSLEQILSGADNSSFFIVTQSSAEPDRAPDGMGQFVLTLFESIPEERLTPYIELTRILHEHDLPVPCPICDSDGKAVHRVHGKPAVLTPRIAGQAPSHPGVAQCMALGESLAAIHQVTQNANLAVQGRDLDWLAAQAHELAARLPASELTLLGEVQHFQQLAERHPTLPQAVIHGDLFRDNTLFIGDRLQAIIDFNTAHNGPLILDLAIAANDWCSDPEGRLVPSLSESLVAGYQRVRPLLEVEKKLWSDSLR
ncbi:MAG: phosphotransferase, partial [Pseudomonadota bacterium]